MLIIFLGLNVDLGSSESQLQGRTFQWPDTGLYFTGLEVFHSLHCLVRILLIVLNYLHMTDNYYRIDSVKLYTPITIKYSTIQMIHRARTTLVLSDGGNNTERIKADQL